MPPGRSDAKEPALPASITDFETALKRRRHITDTLIPHIVVQMDHA